jgi:hypothetical protein
MTPVRSAKKKPFCPSPLSRIRVFAAWALPNVPFP